MTIDGYGDFDLEALKSIYRPLVTKTDDKYQFDLNEDENHWKFEMEIIGKRFEFIRAKTYNKS